MVKQGSRRSIALTGTVLLVVATAGCGRLDAARVDGGNGSSPASAPGFSPAAAGSIGGGATTPADPAESSATRPPGTTGSVATPPTVGPPTPPTPPATPDLSAIQQLLDGIDALLDADATAETDEGSPN